DDERLEDAAFVGVVQLRELGRDPCDGEALTAAGGMLNEVTLAGAVSARVIHETSDGVELLIAWKDQETSSRLPAFFVFFFEFLDELANEVEDAVACPDALPQIRGGVPVLRWWDRRIAGSAEFPLVE